VDERQYSSSPLGELKLNQKRIEVGFDATFCSIVGVIMNTIPLDIFLDRESYGDYIHPSSAGLLLFQYAGREVNVLLWECLKRASSDGQLEYHEDPKYKSKRVVYKPSIESFGEPIDDSKP